jgi:crossover junction endodeoxyribonuclease RusA
MRFTVYVKPQPQGSSKAFVRGKHAVITSDNTKLKPFRNEVTAVALNACRDESMTWPIAGKHVPVSLALDFYFDRPPSIPRKRSSMVVKPDIDKLARATLDALTGVLFADDAQVTELNVIKRYGSPERVEISVTVLETAVLQPKF